MRIGRVYMELHREMRSAGYRPDLVHLHNAAEAAVPACRMAEAWGVPLVVSENWTAYHAEHGRSFRPMEERAVKRVLQAAAVHLPVSEHLGRAMSRYAPDVRQVVIPNVVDAAFMSPATLRSEADGQLSCTTCTDVNRLPHGPRSAPRAGSGSGTLYLRTVWAEEGQPRTDLCDGSPRNETNTREPANKTPSQRSTFHMLRIHRIPRRARVGGAARQAASDSQYLRWTPC